MKLGFYPITPQASRSSHKRLASDRWSSRHGPSRPWTLTTRPMSVSQSSEAICLNETSSVPPWLLPELPCC